MKLVKRYMTFFIAFALGLNAYAQDTVSTSSGRIVVNKDGTWQKLDSNTAQVVKTPRKTKSQKQTYLKTITLMRSGPDPV